MRGVVPFEESNVIIASQEVLFKNCSRRVLLSFFFFFSHVMLVLLAAAVNQMREENTRWDLEEPHCSVQ